MKINYFVQKTYQVVDPNQGVTTIESKLLLHSVVVVKEENTNTLLGILTSKDIQTRPNNLVIDCLAPKPKLTPEMTISEALSIMEEEQEDILPVYADNAFEGLLFKNDLIGFMTAQKIELEEKIKERTEELERVNAVLKESEKILTSIFDSTHGVMFLVSPACELLFFNKKARDDARMYHQQEIQAGDKIMKYISGTSNTYKISIEEIERALKGEYVLSEKELPDCISGNSRWLKNEYVPVYEHGSHYRIGVAIAVEDITQRKHGELLILQQHGTLKDIVRIQSHQVRQPVANILGLISLFDIEPLSAENKELVGYLQNAAVHLDSIIAQVVISASHYYKQTESLAPEEIGEGE